MHDSNLNGFLQRSKAIKSYLDLNCIVSAKRQMNTEERKCQRSIDCGLRPVTVSLSTVGFDPLLAFHAFFHLSFLNVFTACLHFCLSSLCSFILFVFCL